MSIKCERGHDHPSFHDGGVMFVERVGTCHVVYTRMVSDHKEICKGCEGAVPPALQVQGLKNTILDVIADPCVDVPTTREVVGNLLDGLVEAARHASL